MIALETLVRPFATPTATFTPRQIASAQKQAAQIARLVWGQAGSLPTPQAAPSPFLSFKVVTNNKKLTEIPLSRKVENVTVTNPNDSSQYVVVQRIKEMQFSSPTDTSQGGTADGSTTDYTAYQNDSGTTSGSGTQGNGGQQNYDYVFDNTAIQDS
jgi:hypothetical protein